MPTIAVVWLAILAAASFAAQDRFALQVPGGLAFSDFRGDEDWQTIAVSHNGDKLATILGNPAMIEAYKAGIPGNGKPFPDGAKMAKIHWTREEGRDPAGRTACSRARCNDIDFMVKDSTKFADSGGWGYAQFDYNIASGDNFKPGDANSEPRPQGQRRQVRVCVPYDRRAKGLRLHGLSETVNAINASGLRCRSLLTRGARPAIGPGR